MCPFSLDILTLKMPLFKALQKKTMTINIKPKKFIGKKIMSELRFWEVTLLLKIHPSGSGFVMHELTLTCNLSKLTLESYSDTTNLY